MKLSPKPIEFLVGIITGDSGLSEYRSGPELVNFFNSHGESDLYGQGFPSRHIFVREKLQALNGGDRIKAVVESAFDALDEEKDHAEDVAFQFSKLAAQDGIKLRKDNHYGFYHGNEYVQGPIYFEVVTIERPMRVQFEKVFLTHPSLKEGVAKARRRIEDGDFDGAITTCYTIIEQFLKLSLQKRDVTFKKTEGDIKKLYKLYAASARLEVNAETEASLRPLLNGLSGLVTGFYEIANKAGDRHVSLYRPASRHAVLVVNLTFAFCEYLVASSQQD